MHNVSLHRVHAFLDGDVQMFFIVFFWGGNLRKYYWERLCQYSCHYISALRTCFANLRFEPRPSAFPVQGRLCTHVIRSHLLSFSLAFVVLYVIFFFREWLVVA